MSNKFLLASLFLVVAGFGCQKPPIVTPSPGNSAVEPSPAVQEAPKIPAGWILYSNADLGISFAHPAGVRVAVSEDGHTMTLIPGSEADGMVPDMTVTVVDGNVEFAKWEDFEVEYFDELRATFRFAKK